MSSGDQVHFELMHYHLQIHLLFLHKNLDEFHLLIFLDQDDKYGGNCDEDGGMGNCTLVWRVNDDGVMSLLMSDTALSSAHS